MYCDSQDRAAWKIKPRRTDGDDCLISTY
jgi:hypothetical protein